MREASKVDEIDRCSTARDGALRCLTGLAAVHGREAGGKLLFAALGLTAAWPPLLAARLPGDVLDIKENLYTVLKAKDSRLQHLCL